MQVVMAWHGSEIECLLDIVSDQWGLTDTFMRHSFRYNTVYDRRARGVASSISLTTATCYALAFVLTSDV
jgi:hypothetical protein